MGLDNAVGYSFRCDQIHLNINALGRTEDLIHDKGHEPLFRAEQYLKVTGQSEYL